MADPIADLAGVGIKSIETQFPTGVCRPDEFEIASTLRSGRPSTTAEADAWEEERVPDDRTPSLLWPADSPAATAHVTMLQGIISRLASNSASCKTWCLALVSALLSLAGAAHVPAMVSFALVPVIIFGLLDSMYLAQERAYRSLFGTIVGSIRAGTYRLEQAYEARAPLGRGAFLKAFLSWSVWPVYGGLLIAYAVAAGFGWLQLLAIAPNK
jgi:hypothetical protein